MILYCISQHAACRCHNSRNYPRHPLTRIAFPSPRSIARSGRTDFNPGTLVAYPHSHCFIKILLSSHTSLLLFIVQSRFITSTSLQFAYSPDARKSQTSPGRSLLLKLLLILPFRTTLSFSSLLSKLHGKYSCPAVNHDHRQSNCTPNRAAATAASQSCSRQN